MKLSSHTKYKVLLEKWRQSHSCKVLPNHISKHTVHSCKTVVMFLKGRKTTKKFRDRCAICCSKIPDGEFPNPLMKGREFIFFSAYSFMRKTLLFNKQLAKLTFHYYRMKNLSQCSSSFPELLSLSNDTYIIFPIKTHLHYLFFHYASPYFNLIGSFTFFSHALLIRHSRLVVGLGLTGGLRCNQCRCKKWVGAKNRAVWWH